MKRTSSALPMLVETAMLLHSGVSKDRRGDRERTQSDCEEHRRVIVANDEAERSELVCRRVNDPPVTDGQETHIDQPPVRGSIRNSKTDRSFVSITREICVISTRVCRIVRGDDSD